jgi:hypothetical protein
VALKQLTSLNLSSTSVAGNAEDLEKLIKLTSLDLSRTSVTIESSHRPIIAALLAFKASGGSISASLLSSWVVGGFPCSGSWRGVTCQLRSAIKIGGVSSGLPSDDVTGLDLHDTAALSGDVSTLAPVVGLVSLNLHGTVVTGWPLVTKGGHTFYDPAPKVKSTFVRTLNMGMFPGIAICVAGLVFACSKFIPRVQARRAASAKRGVPQRGSGSFSSVGTDSGRLPRSVQFSGDFSQSLQ